MPRYTVSVGAALPTPPRAEDAALPPKDWRLAYGRYFGGQASYALLDVPHGAPLTAKGPPEKVLSAMRAPTLSDYRGLPRHSSRKSALSPPPEGAVARGLVGAVDLPSLLTDPLRKPELLTSLEQYIEQRMGVAAVRAELAAKDAEEQERRPIEQFDFTRIDHFRSVLSEAREIYPALKNVLCTVTREYDVVLQKLRSALEVSTRECLRTALEKQQREIAAQKECIAQQAEVEKKLLAANRELQTAAAESFEREADLRRHVDELRDQLRQVVSRLQDVESEELLRTQEQTRKGVAPGFGSPAPLPAAPQEQQPAAPPRLPEDAADAQVASLRGALSHLERQMRSLQAEKRALLDDVSNWRRVDTELQVEQSRRRLLEAELSQCQELLRDTVVVRGGDSLAPIAQPSAYVSRGPGTSVPVHLRTSRGKVLNTRRLSEEAAMKFLREFWAVRSRSEDRSLPLSDALFDYLCKTEKDETARLELAYALDDVWRQIRGRRADADVLLRVLDGTAPEELLERMWHRIEVFRQIARRQSAVELGSAGRDERTLPLSSVFRAMAELFPHGTNLHHVTSAFSGGPAGAVSYQTDKLKLALYNDCPQLSGDPDGLLVPVLDLLDDQKAPTKLAERVRRRVMQEFDAAHYALARELCRCVGASESKNMTAGALRAAMVTVDGRTQSFELQKRIRACCGPSAVRDTGDVAHGFTVHVPTFVRSLSRKCCVELHGAGSGRRPATPLADT